MAPSKLKIGLLEAQKVLSELGVTTLPVDPFKTAQDLDIMVQAADVDDAGVSGMLLHSNTSFAIVYATHISSEGFRRFSVAHELGHYRIPGHCQQLFSNGVGVHRSRSGFMSSDRIEREADQFAAGLLMPTVPFKTVIRKLPEGLDAVIEAARKCRTSLPATAIRYLDVVDTAVAVVQCSNGFVDYCFMSDALQDFPVLRNLNRGSTAPRGSVTEHLGRDKARVESGARDNNDADLRDWFGGSRALPGTEEVIGLGAYGRTLTVLSTSVLPDDDDEETDLEQRWTAGFRR